MPDIAIRVENLSKRYRIGTQEQRHDTLVGAVMSGLRHPLHNLRRIARLTRFGADDDPDVLWALKDVSFEVPRGEVLGVIGRNGAGKSTLLKILARITYPTHGRVELHGRVASLLEVGTGFHPELTGRENVYLNGTILGMTKSEIDRKFDEIVDFSGIEKFIDTPVKYYSSGMGVRLAFSVAAHLEPEILLVDEVLAVGDMEFQQKCLGKMDEVAKQGRTVIFVSHNMNAISTLSKQGILIEYGRVSFKGEIDEVIKNYSTRIKSISRFQIIEDSMNRIGRGGAKLISCGIFSDSKEPVASIKSGQNLQIEIAFIAQEIEQGSYLSFQIYRYDGVPGIMLFSHMNGYPINPSEKVQRYRIDIEHIPFMPSIYAIKLAICDKGDQIYDFIDPVLWFEILPGEHYHRVFSNPKAALFNVPSKWTKLA